MSDPLYDVLKDLIVPGLSGIGGIVVGAGAIVVAYRSHGLAERVRGDEQKRESDAAREKYRDQLFRTIEPTISAMLEHRAELRRVPALGSTVEVTLRSAAIARLRLVFAVVSHEDSEPLSAVVRSYTDSISLGRAEVLRAVLGQLVLHLAELLEEEHDNVALTKQVDNTLPAMTALADSGMPVQ